MNSGWTSWLCTVACSLLCCSCGTWTWRCFGHLLWWIEWWLDQIFPLLGTCMWQHHQQLLNQVKCHLCLEALADLDDIEQCLYHAASFTWKDTGPVTFSIQPGSHICAPQKVLTYTFCPSRKQHFFVLWSWPFCRWDRQLSTCRSRLDLTESSSDDQTATVQKSPLVWWRWAKRLQIFSNSAVNNSLQHLTHNWKQWYGSVVVLGFAVCLMSSKLITEFFHA